MYTIKDFLNGDIEVHIHTQEQWNAFLDHCTKHGVEFIGGNEGAKRWPHLWDDHGEVILCGKTIYDKKSLCWLPEYRKCTPGMKRVHVTELFPPAVEETAKKLNEDVWAQLNAFDWKPVLEAENKHAPEAVNCRCYVETGMPPKHPRYKIVIECAADHTFAYMYVDDNLVKMESAKRNPADKFNWRIGAQTAFDRLWKKKKKHVVQEVRRRAKPGEWVKVIEATNDDANEYKNGDVLLIVPYTGSVCPELAHYKDRGTKFLYDKEYVVLEGYKPET